MSFIFPLLLSVGLPLIGLPLLIHLINLRRHRRVQWAAMDFLLESQKRNKNWILLRQLLLLLLRTAAVAAIVLMLAGPTVRSEWGSFFGKGTTHHIILLDDSYSMADQMGQTKVFDEAKRVAQALLDQASMQEGSQKFTVLRFSQPTINVRDSLTSVEEKVDSNSIQALQEKIKILEVSETSAGPLATIQASLNLPEALEGETRIAYLISDFRSPQWVEGTEIEQAIRKLRAQVNQLQLIQCVEEFRPNLAITALEPESGVRAAGVETWMKLTLKNFSDTAVPSAVVSVAQDGHSLPAVKFDEIGAGEEVSQRFRTVFLGPGSHQLEASIESDAVDIDNYRYFACDIPAEFPVLLIDGSKDGDDGYYLRTALNPGGDSKPGWNPKVERPEFLRKHELLSEFAAIILLNVPRLDPTEVQALEEYVEEGGGLGIFLGSQIQRPFYNEKLYRDGTGLLPVLLDVPTQLLNSVEDAGADIVVGDHPLFRVFQGQRNSYLSLVSIHLYYGVDISWQPPTDGSTRILAKLRNQAPYVVERGYGKGLVVLQLSKLSPKGTRIGAWSNWSVNPMFPVYAHELIGYLSSTRRQADLQEIGAPLEIRIPESDYEPEISIQMPRSTDTQSQTVIPRAEDGEYFVEAGIGEHSGIWQFGLQRRGAGQEKRLVAVNIDNTEGDLHFLDREGLANRLEGVDYEYMLASQMQTGDTTFAGYQLKDPLMYLLILVLLFEQWLAYRASYLTA